MANKIILKKSSVPSKIPQPSDLDFGELAINYADGKLYYKNTSNEVSSFEQTTLDGLSDVTITSPTTGQVLKYNGTIWVNDTDSVGSGNGSSVSVSVTAPESPEAGDLWLDSSTITLYIYYTDEDSSQWVEIGGGGGSGGGSGNGSSVSVSVTAPESPEAGDLWLDSSTITLYIYYTDEDSSQWVQVSDSDGPIINSRVLANFNTREYTGDGTTTQFTVSSGLYESGVIVTENGILQLPTVDYTISDTTLTFTTAPANNVQIQIREIAFTNIWKEITTNHLAVKGQKLFVDSSSSVTVTLPTSPAMGDEVTIVDATGNAAINNIIVNRNGNNIAGAAENLVIDINDAAVTLAYYNATRGWLVVGGKPMVTGSGGSGGGLSASQVYGLTTVFNNGE